MAFGESKLCLRLTPLLNLLYHWVKRPGDGGGVEGGVGILHIFGDGDSTTE